MTRDEFIKKYGLNEEYYPKGFSEVCDKCGDKENYCRIRLYCCGKPIVKCDCHFATELAVCGVKVISEPDWINIMNWVR